MSKINKLIQQGKETLHSKVNVWKAVVAATVFSVFWATDAQAQQGFSTMVVSPDGTTLTTKTRDLANGKDINTVDGPKYFSSWVSNKGIIGIYNETTGESYEGIDWSFGDIVTVPNETIGTWTASYNPNQQINRWKFKDWNNASNTLPITMIDKSHTGTINGDPSISPRKILRQEYILNNINSLPDNTRIFIGSRAWFIGPDWIDRNGISDGIKKVNGVWTEPSQSPRWNPLNNQWPTLGLDNPSNPWHDANVSPNPADGIVRLNDGLPEDNSYDIKIFAINGTKIKEIKGYQEENDIDVSWLPAGTYLIEAIDPKTGAKFFKKLIKN